MKNENRPLILALALYFVLTALLIARVPLAASPDESAHWEYIEHIATVWRLPVFKGVAPPNPGYEFHQPPLYYALCAPLWAVLPAGVENYSARVVSLLCGLGVVAFVWMAARELFPRSWIPALATLFVALSPLHQGVGAGVNNDSLAGLICAALLWLIAKVWHQGASTKDAIWMGVLAALGMWTKNTTLTVSFAACLALYSSLKRHSLPLRPLLAAFGVACVLALPLWIRNTLLYGDPLALKVFSQAATAGTPGYPQFSQAGIDFFTYARGMLWMIFLTSWGFFGGPTSAASLTKPLAASGPVVRDTALAIPMLICVLIPLVGVLGWRRLENIDQKFDGTWKWWVLATVLVVLAWANFAYNHFSGGQARYMHGAILPVAIALAAGWAALFGEKKSGLFPMFVVGIVMVGLTLLNAFVWRTLV